MSLSICSLQVLIYIYIIFSATCAVTMENLLCVHNCTKCIVTCYAQHVSLPACISGRLGSPNSWAHCPLHISYVIWVSQFSLAMESFCFHGLNCASLTLSTCPLPPHPASYHHAWIHSCFWFLLWPHCVPG